MAFPVTLNGRTYTLADFEGTNYVDGLPDAFEDFVTHAGSIYKTTSTTSNTIGTGSKSFTTADNSLPYQVGTPLRISDGAAPATNWMDGIVTAYSGTSLTVNVVSYAGSGTLTDWDINIGGGGTSYTGTLPIAQGGTGATTAGAAATNLGLGTGDSPTFAGLTVDTNTLYVDSANNRVGIGTASPDTLTLHVQNGAVSGAPSPNTNCDVYIEGTTDTGIQFTSGTQMQLRFGDAASTAAGSIIYNHSDDSLRVSTNGSERMRIDSSGNVGIGTSSPVSKLSIQSPSGQNALLEIAANGNTLGSTSALYGQDAVGNAYAWQRLNGPLLFGTNNSERARIDSSGNLLVGKTTTGVSNYGFAARGDTGGSVEMARDGGTVLYINRGTSNGTIIDIRTNNIGTGIVGASSNYMYLGDAYSASGAGFHFVSTNIRPFNAYSGTSSDNVIDLGTSITRFDDIYATNGTIQTSDRNEKQQIASLTDAEITAAKAISKLFKTFKWNDKVAEKGDAARTHAGVIAQDVAQAMTDAGLDAGNYAFFISTTWWETQTEVPAVEAVEAQDAVYEDVIIPAVEEQLDEEGNVVVEAQPERVEQNLVSEAIEAVEAKEAYTRTDTYDTLEEAPEGATERTRLGIRYPELLAFIGAATEQRLASIEARLDALEA